VGIKVGSGLGVAITGWLLTFGGYVGGMETQSESALALLQVEKANKALRG
jgi:GPH family glycoside/pentoside/hexuronide:cation symporter